MKSFALTLVGILCCITLSFSQDYFYDEDRPIKVNFDLEYKVIHFQNQSSFTSFLNSVPQTIKVEKVIPKYNAIVLYFRGNNNPDMSIAQEFNIEGIKDESFALELEDNFNLYLGYELLLSPRYGINIENTTIVRDVISQGGKLYSDAYGSYHLAVKDPLSSLRISNELVEANLVNWAHPNFYSNHTRYTDPLYGQQYQMNNTGQSISGVSGTSDVDCDAAEAWGITTGSDQIKVAVIDDGVEAHPDLEDASGNTRLEPGNTPSNGGDGSPILNSDAHATACAGIIAASHNDQYVRGMAPNVKLISVNIFEGSETVSDIANAFNYARTHGADVISNSWGYTSCTLSLSAINSAINNARNNGRGGLGCVVVFASGNGYKTCVDYPADLSYVMAVGAVTSLGEHSLYANEGPALDVVAPSNSAPGQSGPGVRTLDRVGSAGYNSGNSTTGFGGTSAACPVVSGCAALILSYDPSLTGDEVRTLLEDNATDMGTSGFDNTFGHGRVSVYDALMSLNPVNPVSCTTVINQFPYQEGFEAGLGDWIQSAEDDFNWTINSGGTPSSSTGPSNAAEGTQYIYTESSSPNYPSKRATLVSPCFDLNAVSNPDLAFDYHMYGLVMGILKVEGSTDGENWTTLETISGNQGDFWNTHVISLSNYTNVSEFSIRFEVTTSNSYTSDVAIDNIEIGVSGTVGITDPCANGFINSFPYIEGFETGTGNWIQSNDDDMNWTLHSGSTPSNGTGPSSAAEGNQYIYMETSSPNYPSKTAVLEHSCLDISSLNNPAFYMIYNMYGNSVGSLVIEAREAGNSWQEIYSLSGQQGNSWQTAIINLNNFSGAENLQLKITGTSGSSWAGDIALDAIGIGEDIFAGGSVCSSSESLPFADGFENGDSNWLQATNDNLDWIIHSGSTPSSQTGPSNAQEGNNYFYIEASSPNYPSKTATATSPCVDLSQIDNAELKFYCHMYGSTMGQLTVEGRSNEDQNWTTLWSQTGELGNFWQLVEISLADYYGASGVQVRFTGTTGTSYRSDIAIDGLEIATASGSGTTACPKINFTNEVVSYGLGQDNGTYAIFLGGERVDLNDNAWKAHPYSISINPNTMLEFEFKSTSEGEIHGIGFDNDNGISTDLSFQLTGTQNWGIQNYNNYSGTGWKSYSIPVGQFFTGSFDKLTFINDNDAGSGNDSRFRNVKVYDTGTCNPGIQMLGAVSEVVIAGNNSDEEIKMTLFPNPARQSVRIGLNDLNSLSAQVRITDITGKTILLERFKNPNQEFDVSTFAPGVYLVNVQLSNSMRITKKLVVAQ